MMKIDITYYATVISGDEQQTHQKLNIHIIVFTFYT